MLLAERCTPGDQAISREAAAPLFSVLTAEQVFDAVATSAGHCARSTGSRRRQAPAAGVCGEPIIVRSATSQKGMKCPNQFTPSIMHMMGKVASGCAPLVQRLKEPCQSSEGSRSLSSRPAWSTAGPVVAFLFCSRAPRRAGYAGYQRYPGMRAARTALEHFCRCPPLLPCVCVVWRRPMVGPDRY